MANYSLSIARNGLSDPMSAGASSQITLGTLAPNAGTVEVRIANVETLSGNEVHEILEVLARALENVRPSPLAL